MKPTKSVSWRTSAIAICACLLASSLVIFLTRQNTIKPNELASSTAAHWLVHRSSQQVVLVDGFSGRLLARVDAGEDADDAVTVQGEGGAFLVSNATGNARSISTAKLRLGTPRPLEALAASQANIGVGSDGLTVVDGRNGRLDVLSVDASARSIDVPAAGESIVSGDGSAWLLGNGKATHVRIDNRPTVTFDLAGARDDITSIGADPLTLDRAQRIVHWLGGLDVSIGSFSASRSAVLQEPGPGASCAWLGSGDELACVGRQGIDRRVTVPGLQIDPDTRFAMLDSTIVVVHADNSFGRFDLGTAAQLGETTIPPPSATPLAITATDEVIWLDDRSGDLAWVIQRFGQRQVNKQDRQVPAFTENGESAEGDGDGNGSQSGGRGAGDAEGRQLDLNGVDDPPIAVDDELTAGADKQSITIPVTDNDFDPDGDAIAVTEVEPAGYGETFVLNATTVVYRPTPGRWGKDSFSYSITDQNGNDATAEVRLEVFAPDRANEAPNTKDDEDTTRVEVAVEIDVLANDVDPERDDLAIATIDQPENGTAERIGLASGRPGIRYTPDDGAVGSDTFTYTATDSQGRESRVTKVVVIVSARSATNQAPVALPDAIRVRIDQPASLAVLQNDSDPDNDLLTLSLPPTRPPAMTVKVVGEQLQITARAGLPTRSTFTYIVSDSKGKRDTGTVLVLLDDPREPNRPPIANPDSSNVVEGGSVDIEVLANDTDPDADQILLRSVTQPEQQTGIVTRLDDGKVRFTSTATGLTKATPVTFSYEIADPDDLRATGIVIVTVSPPDAASPAVAVDDVASVYAGESQTVPVLNNDTTSAEPLQILGEVSCLDPLLRAAVSNNRVILTADRAAAAGPTTCRYDVIDQRGSKDAARINVEILPANEVNRPPEQINTKLIPVNVGDTVKGYPLMDRVTDADGDPLTFSYVPASTRGEAEVVGTALRYTPPQTTGADPVQLTVTDGVNSPVAIEIVFDVRPSVRAKPFAGSFDQATLARSVRLDWRSAASYEGGDKSTLQAVLAGSGGDNVTISNTNGSFVIVAKDGFYGSFAATYTIRDIDEQVSDPATISVEFLPPEDRPPTANSDRLDVDANGQNRVNVLANDDDEDLGTLTAQLLSAPTSAFGQGSLTADGQFSFTAKPDQDGGTSVFRYRATDAAGESSESTITVTVRPCGQGAPVISAPDLTVGLFERPIIDLTQYVTNGTIYQVTGGGLTGPTGRLVAPTGSEEDVIVRFSAKNSCDVSIDGTLKVQINRPPVATAVFRSMGRGTTLTLAAGQLASDDAGETLLIDPLPATAPPWVELSGDRSTITASPPRSLASGSFNFTVAVRDPGSGRVEVPITIEVVNQAPLALPDQRTTEIDSISLDPRVNDSDPEGSGLTIVSAAVRSGQADVTVFEDHVTITNLSHGVVEVNYTIVDEDGATASSVIRIVFNVGPTARNESLVMYESTLTFELPVEDPDGDPLFVIAAGPDDFTTTTSVVDGRIFMTLRANREFDLGTSIYFFYSVVDPFGEASEAIIFLELQIPGADASTP